MAWFVYRSDIISKVELVIRLSEQTQNICLTFEQRRPSVFDVGPTLYKSYTNVLCLLVCRRARPISILLLLELELSAKSPHTILNKCWPNFGPPSATLAQH